MKKAPALLALLVATLALAACGTNGNATGGDGTTSSAATFNHADATFAQDMIPHHQQAVVMAKMAGSHSASPEVNKLATEIAGAQGPEIETMTKWLNKWKQKMPSSTGQDMGGMNSSSMPGMMSSADMSSLDRARGKDWDRMFLTMMVKHHTGAIEMARSEQADGKNADAVALAKKIEAAQTTEIATMKAMLAP